MSKSAQVRFDPRGRKVKILATVGPASRDPEMLAFITQTTLSVDDTADIVAALRARFPAIIGPHKEDICYATTNRQEAVKAIAPKIDGPTAR